MLTLKTIAEVRTVLAGWRAHGERIAFIPTMGNLHAGHLSLVKKAQRTAKRVVVSIFVNPLQFGKNEDFKDYPSTFEEDSDKLAEICLDVLFAPGQAEMYPEKGDLPTWVEVPLLSEVLCGAFRPGHFRGVATVVAKLFNIVQPDVALFGEKDYQQLLLIRRVVEDLNLPIEILAAPTVREPDGLAMSSRNRYLTMDQRRVASALYQTLCTAQARVKQGEHDFHAIESAGIKTLVTAGFTPDYFQLCRAQDLHPAKAGDKEVVIMAAAWLGKARLIDNVRFTL
jgi:pantoate--beta-alanine ligase